MDLSAVIDSAEQLRSAVVLSDIRAGVGQRALRRSIQCRHVAGSRADRAACGIADGAAFDGSPGIKRNAGAGSSGSNVRGFIHDGDVNLQIASARCFDQALVGDCADGAEKLQGQRCISIDNSGSAIGYDQAVVSNSAVALNYVVDVSERTVVRIVNEGLAAAVGLA